MAQTYFGRGANPPQIAASSEARPTLAAPQINVDDTTAVIRGFPFRKDKRSVHDATYLTAIGPFATIYASTGEICMASVGPIRRVSLICQEPGDDGSMAFRRVEPDCHGVTCAYSIQVCAWQRDYKQP